MPSSDIRPLQTERWAALGQQRREMVAIREFPFFWPLFPISKFSCDHPWRRIAVVVGLCLFPGFTCRAITESRNQFSQNWRGIRRKNSRLVRHRIFREISNPIRSEHLVRSLETTNRKLFLPAGRRHLFYLFFIFPPSPSQVVAISITGAFRKGKSFLLNFFLDYLYKLQYTQKNVFFFAW